MKIGDDGAVLESTALFSNWGNETIKIRSRIFLAMEFGSSAIRCRTGIGNDASSDRVSNSILQHGWVPPDESRQQPGSLFIAPGCIHALPALPWSHVHSVVQIEKGTDACTPRNNARMQTSQPYLSMFFFIETEQLSCCRSTILNAESLSVNPNQFLPAKSPVRIERPSRIASSFSRSSRLRPSCNVT